MSSLHGSEARVWGRQQLRPGLPALLLLLLLSHFSPALGPSLTPPRPAAPPSGSGPPRPPSVEAGLPGPWARWGESSEGPLDGSLDGEGGGAGVVGKARPSGPLAVRVSPLVGDAQSPPTPGRAGRRPCRLASHLQISSGGVRGTS